MNGEIVIAVVGPLVLREMLFLNLYLKLQQVSLRSNLLWAWMFILETQ
jgi:hypothetical protein